MKKPPLGEKDVLNPEEAITYFGFSRRKFYRFLNEGKCKKITALYGRVHFFRIPYTKVHQLMLKYRSSKNPRFLLRFYYD